MYQPASCVHPSSISYNELLKQQEIDAATEQKYIADKDAAYVKNIGDATEQAAVNQFNERFDAYDKAVVAKEYDAKNDPKVRCGSVRWRREGGRAA